MTKRVGLIFFSLCQVQVAVKMWPTLASKEACIAVSSPMQSCLAMLSNLFRVF